MFGTRSLYDEGVREAATQMSTGVLAHLIDPVRVRRCDDCRPSEPGMIGSIGVSTPADRTLADVSAELRGLGMLHTRDPNLMWKPTCTKCGHLGPCEECEKMVHLPDCGSHRVFSRLVDPACNLRGTGINRAAYLPRDPQELCRLEHPGQIGQSSRLQAKDKHVPCVPIPIDSLWVDPRDTGIPTCPTVGGLCGTYINPEDYDSFRK